MDEVFEDMRMLKVKGFRRAAAVISVLLAALLFSVSAFAGTVYIHPTGAGTYTQWTNVGGTANYDSVNDNGNQPTGGPGTKDDDGTHVTTTTTSAKDSYGLPDNPTEIPAGSTITDIEVFIYAKKSAAQSATINIFHRVNGGDSALGTNINPANGTY